MSIADKDVVHLFEKLRSGLVPERGLDAIAEGVERPRAELGRQLGLAAAGEGCIKFLRGGYGCGKTFMARLATLDAQAAGFATSFVVVSDNDLRFHKFDEVYSKVVSELSTDECQRGALDAMLDRWICAIEERLEASGVDPDAEDFDTQVRRELERALLSLTAGKIPMDFVRVVQAYFDAKQAGDYATSAALLSWLSGSKNVAAAAKRSAGIKGDINSSDAMEYLRGVVEITRAAGYRGLLVVIDEAETILRMRSDGRRKSLNGIRQIADSAGSYEGLLWIFTGTPEFFDTRRGVAGLAPLYDRIGLIEKGGFASLKQPQLQLKPFDKGRLLAVANRLVSLFPARDRLGDRVSADFLGRLVDEVSAGLKADVGVVPRVFLRELIEVLDLCEEYAEYVPAERYGFNASERALTPEERRALDGGDETFAPVEDTW